MVITEQFVVIGGRRISTPIPSGALPSFPTDTLSPVLRATSLVAFVFTYVLHYLLYAVIQNLSKHLTYLSTKSTEIATLLVRYHVFCVLSDIGSVHDYGFAYIPKGFDLRLFEDLYGLSELFFERLPIGWN